MMQINLLPWRENRRALKQRHIKIACIFSSVLLSILLMGFYQYPKKPISPKRLPSHQIISPAASALEKIQYVGFVSQGERKWGLIQLSIGEVREIKIGSFVTTNAERVIAINASEVLVKVLPHTLRKIKMIGEPIA